MNQAFIGRCPRRPGRINFVSNNSAGRALPKRPSERSALPRRNQRTERRTRRALPPSPKRKHVVGSGLHNYFHSENM